VASLGLWAVASCGPAQTRVDPDASEKRYLLGADYFNKGLVQPALEELLKAVDLNPNNPDALFQSGLLAVQQNKPADAQRYLAKLQQVAPDNAHIAELDAAIRESRASEDIDFRRKAFATVQRIVMENAFVAPLAFQFELVAMNKKVQGYRPNLLGKPKYDDVWLES